MGEIKKVTKSWYFLKFTEERLQILFDKLASITGYDQYFECGVMDNKSPSDEVEEFLIDIYKALKSEEK